MIRIEFSTDNAAFDDDFDGEVARVMEQAEDLIHFAGGVLYDSNGNDIGEVVVEEDEDEV